MMWQNGKFLDLLKSLVDVGGAPIMPGEETV